MLRLGAEFFVIVVGVLVALAVDQWAQERDDREMEVEYLERLLADVRYDLDELTFIRERSQASADYGRLVLDDGWVLRAPVDSLVGISYSALQTRAPDLSRATFEELISSGRIDLIRSRAVREALADYERTITELTGFFELAHLEGFLWMWERLPPDQRVAYEAECRGPAGAISRIVLRMCPFEWDMDSERLRRDLLDDEGRKLLRRTTNRNLSAVNVAGLLLEAARELESVLASDGAP